MKTTQREREADGGEAEGGEEMAMQVGPGNRLEK